MLYNKKAKEVKTWCIAIAFAAWVAYDLAKGNLIAVSITWAVWKVYKEA